MYVCMYVCMYDAWRWVMLVYRGLMYVCMYVCMMMYDDDACIHYTMMYVWMMMHVCMYVYKQGMVIITRTHVVIQVKLKIQKGFRQARHAGLVPRRLAATHSNSNVQCLCSKHGFSNPTKQREMLSVFQCLYCSNIFTNATPNKTVLHSTTHVLNRAKQG